MRYLLLIAIICTSGFVIPAQSAIANGPGEPIPYNETRINYIIDIPDAVCGLYYEYYIEGNPGDVITITAQRIEGTGDLEPLITVLDGNQRLEGINTGASAIFENYVLKPGRDYHLFEVSSRAGTTGEFEVTVTLTGQQDVSHIDPFAGNVQSFAVGSRPAHSVWDGARLYVSNFNSQNIMVLDQQGQVINTFPFPGNPAAMQWDGSRLWVADRTGDSVYVFDPAGNQLASYQVGNVPISMSYSDVDHTLWIALYDDSQVVALDMEGNELVRVDTPNLPSTILNYGAGSAWVTLYGEDNDPGSSVINVGLDGKIRDEYALYAYPDDLAYGGDHLYVAYGGSNTLTQFDFLDKERFEYEVAGGNIIDMAWDGEYLWLTLDSNEVIALSVVDYGSPSFAVSGYFEEVLRVPTDARPFGVTYAMPFIWVANRGTQDNPGSTITRIDTAALFGGNTLSAAFGKFGITVLNRPVINDRASPAKVR